MKKLREKVKDFPITPGVYVMRNARGDAIYIGKAKSLKKRALSYFRIPAPTPKITVLMEKVERIDYIDTPTEMDALLLEAHLVRKHQPRYNQELKDDKSFPLLKITKEKFPRLSITRRKEDKNAIYYGPYTSSLLLKQAINLIQALFPIRKCRTLPKSACLYFHIGQCVAPCIHPEVRPKYDLLIEELKTFLGGGKKSFVQYLKERMEDASKATKFEEAKFFKDQIDALGKLKRKRFFPKNPGKGISLSATLELKETLNLAKIPARIVCFDVSNVQGNKSVASRVAFYREFPDKASYRRYRIKDISGINDYAMISQALTRMIRGINERRERFIPDLIVIDGGLGHLNAAIKILRQEKMENVEIVSIAKQFEWIYSPKFLRPIVFDSTSPAIYLLKKIRDEAHRFAITYHRSLKSKSLEESELDKIEGIGVKRKRLLLKKFENIDKIRDTSINEIAKIDGFDIKIAKKIIEFLNSKI